MKGSWVRMASSMQAWQRAGMAMRPIDFQTICRQVQTLEAMRTQAFSEEVEM